MLFSFLFPPLFISLTCLPCVFISFFLAFTSSVLCPSTNRSPVRCSTWGPVSSSGKVSLFVLSTVGSQSVHQPCHQHCQHTHTYTHTLTHVSTSPPLTGRCHSGRQLQSLVWLLSSNQRPSSLSTATWPWGYHCHTAHTPLNTHTHSAHTHTDSGEEEEETEEEVAVFYLESWFPLY